MAWKYQAYPEYKDSGVEWFGSIPMGWDIGTLRRSLLEHKQGYYTTNSYVDNGVKLLRITDLGDYGEIDISDCPQVPSSDQSLANYDLKEGDVVFARTGGAGSFGVVKNLSERVVFASYLIRFRFCENRFINDYLRYMLLADSFQKAVKQNVHGGVNKNIHAEDIKNAYLARPPLEEQEKIINFLDHETAKIDTLIEKQQQLIKLLKEKRQAVISHAVTKGLNPNAPMRESGIEWLGEVPEDWTVCKIKQVARLESGHTPDKKIEAYWINCDIPWVSLNDSTQLKQVDYITKTAFYLNEKGIENSSARKLPERCVVFTRDASIGLAAITTRVMAVSQHVIAWVCDKEKVIPEYLLLVFYAMKEELDRYTVGATLKTIGLTDVNKLSGAFPDVKEQEKISEYTFSEMKKFDLLIDKADEFAGIIRERRTALISAAVTGKIDVRGWVAPAHPCAPDMSTSMHATIPKSSRNTTHTKETVA